MNKEGLDALERLVDGNLNEVNYYRQFCDSTTYIMKDKKIIEKELKDFEWLKSKVSIDWFDKLSSEDKIRFMEIMGVEI